MYWSTYVWQIGRVSAIIQYIAMVKYRGSVQRFGVIVLRLGLLCLSSLGHGFGRLRRGKEPPKMTGSSRTAFETGIASYGQYMCLNQRYSIRMDYAHEPVAQHLSLSPSESTLLSLKLAKSTATKSRSSTSLQCAVILIT